MDKIEKLKRTLKEATAGRCVCCGKPSKAHTYTDNIACINKLYKIAKLGNGVKKLKLKVIGMPESAVKEMFLEVGKKY